MTRNTKDMAKVAVEVALAATVVGLVIRAVPSPNGSDMLFPVALVVVLVISYLPDLLGRWRDAQGVKKEGIDTPAEAAWPPPAQPKPPKEEQAVTLKRVAERIGKGKARPERKPAAQLDFLDTLDDTPACPAQDTPVVMRPPRKRRNHFIHLDQAAFRRQWESGDSLPRISYDHNTSIPTVKRWARALGLPPRPNIRTRVNLSHLVSLLAGNEPGSRDPKWLAAKLGVSPRAVTKAVARINRTPHLLRQAQTRKEVETL